MRQISPLFALLLTACPDPGYQPDPDRVSRVVVSAEGDVGAVVEGEIAFTWDLYAQLTPDEQGNLFYSPFSALSALGMTSAGAEGETQAQLGAALGVSIPEADWHAALGALTRDLSGDLHRAYTLHVANRLFGQAGYPWEEPFLATCADDYAAPLQPWDFQSDPEGGREAVNTWVSEQTQGRIEDLLPPGSVTSDTRLVLANAIYFLADWANAFDVDNTRDREFTLADGSTVSVPVMHLDLEDLDEPAEAGFDVAWVDGAAVVRLPYEEHEVSMILVVPDEADGLPAIEAGLDGPTWSAWVDALQPTSELLLALPRLELRTEADLIPPLGALGVSDLFDPLAADLTGMAIPPEGGNLRVSGVFHQAFVKVDEAGTEAAAATGVVVTNDSAPMEIAATHPFLFVLHDDLTGAILFVGRVGDPS
jgi:serpin B